jgi:hypothetical protein
MYVISTLEQTNILLNADPNDSYRKESSPAVNAGSLSARIVRRMRFSSVPAATTRDTRAGDMWSLALHMTTAAADTDTFAPSAPLTARSSDLHVPLAARLRLLRPAPEPLAVVAPQLSVAAPLHRRGRRGSLH